MKETRNSENGSIILLVLLILVLVSMYGISSLNSSSTELIITRNNRCYKQNVYRSESAVMEVARILEVEPIPDTNLLPANMPTTPKYSFFAGTSMYDPDNDVDPESVNWVLSGSTSNVTTSTLYDDSRSAYSVVFQGLAPGASYNMTTSQMWQYGLYGLSQLCDGNVGVVGGYRRRF